MTILDTQTAAQLSATFDGRIAVYILNRVLTAVPAHYSARSRKRTIVASTTPLHSLSHLVYQNDYIKLFPYNTVDNLWGFDIKTHPTIELSFFFLNNPAPPEIYSLPLPAPLPI